MVPYLLSLTLTLAPGADPIVIDDDHFQVVGPHRPGVERVARQLRWTIQIFEDLFAVMPRKGRVVLFRDPTQADFENLRDGHSWALPWWTAGGPMAGALTHEVAHMQTSHTVGSSRQAWFQEAVAVYHEPEWMRRGRRANMKRHMRDFIPLPELFVMLHPLDTPDTPKPTGMTVSHHAPDRKSDEVLRFYSQSHAVLEYLIDRGGKPFVRFYVDRSPKGRDMEAILEEWHERREDLDAWVAALNPPKKRGKKKKDAETEAAPEVEIPAGLECLRLRPGEKAGPLPRTLPDLEKEWWRWVVEHYPGHSPRRPKHPG